MLLLSDVPALLYDLALPALVALAWAGFMLFVARFIVGD